MVQRKISLTHINANKLLMSVQGIHKQEQSPIICQCVEEQPQLAHFDDPCHELLHEVSISHGSHNVNDRVEKLMGENQVVSKSFAVTAADASNKRQQQLDSTSSTSTLASSVTADGNFDLDYTYFYRLSHSELVGIEKVAVASASDY
ncbi:hypothetical protein Tco_1466098 [Tanacetum coccineum]